MVDDPIEMWEYGRAIHVPAYRVSALLYAEPARARLDALTRVTFGGLDLRDRTLILDFSLEGTSAEQARILIASLRKVLPVEDPRLFVVFNPQTEFFEVPHICVPGIFARHKADENFEIGQTMITAKFVCAMSRADHTRARIARFLLDATTPDDRILTFGLRTTPEVLADLAPILHPYPVQHLPDDTVTPNEGFGWMNAITPRSDLLARALLNVVVETGSQGVDWVWKSLFVTEKSFKPFYFRQIPIWCALPGLVAQVRSFGFDLFDDLIDHSYDIIPDEEERHAHALKQVVAFSQRSLEGCRMLRVHLAERFNANYHRVHQLGEAEQRRFDEALDMFNVK